MDVRKLRAVILIGLVGMGMVIGESNASFKDCYAKCFLFCMIEPSQTLCSCTTKCLKECIFSSISNSTIAATAHGGDDMIVGHNFCKLGCALSKCSSLSTNHHPNKEKMDGCVGSCSTTCSNSYKSP